MNNIKYFNSDKEVICEYSWRGRRYYGKAKCHPSDTFDLEKGKKLAFARANLKVAEARKKLARAEYREFAYFAEVYRMSCLDARDWLEDAESKCKVAQIALTCLEKEI